MAVSTRSHPDVRPAARGFVRTDPTQQALWLLRIGFTVAPILFGLDKYADLLVEWEAYLAPQIPDVLGTSAENVMYVVGAVEIVAGLTVAVLPRFGGLLVAGWLAGILINLLVIGNYYDVALRDVGLLLAALALSRLATADHRGRRTP